MSLLRIEHVAKQYPTRSEPLVVLRDVSLELNRGQNVAILGPSGSGKSTLLSIIGGLEPPSSGRVVLDDQDPATLPEPALAAFRNRKIGFVFQDHHLLPQCSVLENVLTPTVAGRADVARRTSSAAGCCWTAWAWAIGSIIARPSFPAASGSGRPWRGR